MHRGREPLERSSQLEWMFEATTLDVGVPTTTLTVEEQGAELPQKNRRPVASHQNTEVPVSVQRYRRKALGRRRALTKKLARGWNGPRLSISTFFAVAVAGSMVVHQLWQKSVAHALVLLLLAIYGQTFYRTAVKFLGKKAVKASSVRSMFCLGFGPGLLILFMLELVLGATLLAAYCHGTECSKAVLGPESVRALPGLFEASPSMGVALSFFLAFGNAAFLEEAMKYLFVTHRVNAELRSGAVRSSTGVNSIMAPSVSPRSTPNLRSKVTQRAPSLRQATLVYALACSLGLALSESMLYVCSFATNPLNAVWISVRRMCFSIPVHVTCGILTGTAVIKQIVDNNQSFLRALWQSVLIHGGYDFVLLILPIAGQALEISTKAIDRGQNVFSGVFLVFMLLFLRKRLQALGYFVPQVDSYTVEP